MVNIVGLEGEGSPFVHNPRMKPWLTHLSRSVGYDLSESEGAKKKPPKAMPRGIIFCRAEAELQATYYKPDSSNGDCVLLCESLFYATAQAGVVVTVLFLAEAVAPENGGPWELDEGLVELFKEEARKQNSCKVTRLLPIPNPLSNGIDLSSLDARFTLLPTRPVQKGPRDEPRGADANQARCGRARLGHFRGRQTLEPRARPGPRGGPEPAHHRAAARRGAAGGGRPGGGRGALQGQPHAPGTFVRSSVAWLVGWFVHIHIGASINGVTEEILWSS